jgi:hypothetical protein
MQGYIEEKKPNPRKYQPVGHREEKKKINMYDRKRKKEGRQRLNVKQNSLLKEN